MNKNIMFSSGHSSSHTNLQSCFKTSNKTQSLLLCGNLSAAKLFFLPHYPHYDLHRDKSHKTLVGLNSAMVCVDQKMLPSSIYMAYQPAL